MRPIPRFFQPPKGESFFLLGPRGTGKTTWLRHHFPSALWIDLLDPESYRFYSARAERLRATIDANPQAKVIVIDEIQRLPELLFLIHQMIEEKRAWQFILTGSSTRKLKREGADLLAGRALLSFMHPFMASELGDLFDLDQALKIGLLPVVWDTNNPQKVLETYCALYLREEVQLEGLVRRVGDFARFLEVISFSHATLLNSNNIANECDLSRNTVSTYLSILQDLLLGFSLPVFTKRAKRALIAHQKFYLFDAGVFQALRPRGPLDRPEELAGAALEGVIAQHLRAWIDLQAIRYDLFFWRTRAGNEVDFILYGEGGFWAIEVKNGERVSSQDCNGLTAFCQDYPEATPLLLYRGKRRLVEKGILCMPCEEFLKNLTPGLFPGR